MHAPLPDAFKRPPYRRSWTEAALRFVVTAALLVLFGVPIYLTLVVSDMVPNEDPDYWRLRFLWWGFIVLVIIGARGFAWIVDALIPSRGIPHGPASGYKFVHHA
ncbi:MAG: hypothetical protein CL569_00630 [Alphaproteobacteria bacterium]|nr:hypothetical protein [Alphaproteobacteria bacterium]|tara:strand:- start:474 stop:788 length:315 start_codon:yes stop_codon:yes gene_type:complete